MSDPSTLSDADLLAQIQAAQQSQNQGSMSHTGTQAPSGFLLNDPTSGMSTYDKLAAGTGRGMVHTLASAGNLVGLVPDSAMAEEKKTDAPLLNTTPGTIGNMVGESAITAPAGMGIAKGVGMAGKLGAALASNPVADAALQGGAQGLLTSDPGQRGFNTMIGSGTGGVLGANQALVGKLVNGLKRTPDAQALLNQGISLTPGQMNPTGTWNQFENALEHAPVAGPMVKSARDNAEHQFQAVAIGQGAAPGSPPLKPSGNIHDLLQQAYDSYQPLYDQAKGYPVSPSIVRANGPDVPLDKTFQAASQAPGVPKSLQQSENQWLQDRLTQLPKTPDSSDLLQLRSDIRQRARLANLKTDTDSGHVANINGRAEQGVTAALNSQLPPAPLQALASADSNYGNYKIIENAVAKSKDNLAGLTPQKLSQSIYDSVRDPSYARGAGGPLRDLAQQGTNVFQEVVPPNGKSVAALSLGAAGLALHPALTGAAGAGMGGLVLTPGGRQLAAGLTGPQVTAQKLVSALRSNTPDYARNVGGQLALRGATAAGMPVTQAALPQALAAALMLAPPAAQSH
jgi:hypothetical protein